MNKNFKYYVIAWIILLAVFNAIVFATPSEAAGLSKFGGAFWSGYILITLAFIGQLVCAVFAFKSKTKEKLFLHLPLITISFSALIVSLIVGVVCMVIPGLPNWVGAVACILILGFTALSVVKAKAAASLVSDLGDKVKSQTVFIKYMTANAETLITRAAAPEAKAAAKKVWEAFRYSDPMSDEGLADVESRISQAFDAFARAVTSGAGDVTGAAESVLVLVQDRNTKCKLLK